ncbi:diguanylate cyclase (GGDEF)-like protein [Metabacillus crassostreae]|uniref:diguanylate cyclase n=1 Tax=Metabacillus crassostreae TaxID=929098 RepID=UPI00195D622F|nr:diguanylate cyclase [Metabacillus crassostreae]MBM7603929.1 diguanylate cyclase (GGDEF)-like protein [Metabacillus crassostreae]
MKMAFKKILLIIFILFFTFILTDRNVIFASPKNIIINNEFEKVNIKDSWEVYVDQNNISENEILKKQDKFLPISKVDIDGDIANSTYWIKINILNTSDSPKDILLELKKPHLSLVSLYSVSLQKLELKETIGYSIPFNERSIRHRNLIFPLELQPSEKASTYYLKIKTDSFFQAPITIWDPVVFSIENSNAQMMYGLFYGTMIGLILYNSFLFFSLREKTYFYYILFITGFTTMQSIWDGYAFQWLWGDYPWWALRSNSFFILWTALFALQFAKHFLQLKSKAPILYKMVNIFNTVCAIALILPFTLSISISTMTSTLIATIFVLFIILIAIKVRLKTREAKFFIAAWVFLLIGVLLNILAAYKLVPLTPITLFAPKIGSLVEVLVLSLGLADRIKRITLEKELESKKYYMQTLIQSSFKQMSGMKEITELADSGLNTIMILTKFENGYYLSKNKSGWSLLTQKGENLVNHTFNIDQQYFKKLTYANDVDLSILGIHKQFGSYLSIPIVCKGHEALLIAYSQENLKIDTYEIENVIPYFKEQYMVLIDNIINYQSLQKSAMYDHLTNVLNRKYFLDKANNLMKESIELNQNVTIILIDIDHFKQVNDTYGHNTGDKAIIFVAGQIKEIIKDIGVVGRYGGEEFIALLNNVGEKKALEISELLIKTLHIHPFSVEDGESLFLTVSIGVCSNTNNKNLSINNMIQLADESLYKAKNMGRDQVVIYNDYIEIK